jgi:hypothetical protein
MADLAGPWEPFDPREHSVDGGLRCLNSSLWHREAGVPAEYSFLLVRVGVGWLEDALASNWFGEALLGTCSPL